MEALFPQSEQLGIVFDVVGDEFRFGWKMTTTELAFMLVDGPGSIISSFVEPW